MGKAIVSRYALHVRVTGGVHTPSTWNVKGKYGAKGQGKPTEANIAKYVQASEESCRPNGINEHLGIFSYLRAWIVDQQTGDIVAQWTRPKGGPMFQVIEPLPEGHPSHCHTHGMKTLSERKAS